MFEFVEKYKTPLQVLLGAVALSFIGFGVGSYDVGDDPNFVATVGGQKISRQELTNAIQSQNLPLTAEVKEEVLKGLIAQRLRLAHANQIGMGVADADLAKYIANIPAFQDNGTFSKEKYEQLLKSRGWSVEYFQNMVRNDLLSAQLLDSVVNSGFASKTTTTQLLALFEEQREVTMASFSPEVFASQVKLEADAAKKYYDSHQDEFKQPEQLKLEYVVLSQSDLAAQQSVSEDEVKKYFDSNKDDLAKEERKISHILLTVDSKASAEDKVKIKSKAEALLKKVQAAPDTFAQLARTESQDPGSAANGGDLGYYGKGGGFVKPFEDAAFAMQKGEIKGLIETQFGYHILKLDDLRVKSFDEVKSQIETTLKSQKATQQFASATDKFNDLLYNQPDSLKAVIEQFKLPAKQSDWVTRKSAQEPDLNNPKVLEAVFSDEVVKKKHNSEAVEVMPGKLLAARVHDHRPAGMKTFADVQAEITAKLIQEKAKALALAEGKAKFDMLKAGKSVELSWGESLKLTRQGLPAIDRDGAREIFKLPADKVPGYAASTTPNGGYVIYRLNKVIPADTTADKVKGIAQMMGRQISQVEAMSYVKSLEGKYPVEIRKNSLNSGE
ncbi:SurA N-terminal domain-containing protein [Chitinivorax sp. B]|uniref:SurA N-terminal domain-containing protein n=1 Tax=Chitinivorax sp. B TaxID=2502235 RepID=UPI0010FA09FA|nr:SurA N-terminal domain-containing protein [Chitinivorax sp. B]